MTYENVMFILDMVYLGIFISLVCFCCTLNYWGEKAKKFVKEFVIAYCLLNIFIVWSDNQAAIKWSRISAKKKSCFSNSRVIFSAVEMYNIDHLDSFMKELDMDELYRSRYLISKLEMPTNRCHYKNMGDLSVDGVIYCVEHGFQELEYFNEKDSKKDDIFSKVYYEIKNRKEIESKTFPKTLNAFLANPANIYLVRLLFFPLTLNRHRIHDYYN